MHQIHLFPWILIYLFVIGHATRALFFATHLNRMEHKMQKKTRERKKNKSTQTKYSLKQFKFHQFIYIDFIFVFNAFCVRLLVFFPCRFISFHSFVHTFIYLYLIFSSPFADLATTGDCYYNYNHYSEGDRILTNEPCLNCTCHNKMLMCYLKVCPFTKPIGQDCTIEKREDQCCPIITCPEGKYTTQWYEN